MGETRDDRVGLIATNSPTCPVPPEIGADQLYSCPWTERRFRTRSALDMIEIVSAIAGTRITMPASMVRLS